MRKTIVLISFLVILLTIVSGTIACTSSPSTTSDESTIRAYADPATETTLQGLSDNNLAKYTQDANPEFKAAVTQEILETTANQLNSQLGRYISKKFLKVESQDGYTLVYYRAKYAKAEVDIRMVFDEDQLIAGQWFE